MPRIAGTYQGFVRKKVVVGKVKAESKEAAIRTLLIELAAPEDHPTFENWVNGGMEIELVPTVS